MGRNILKKLDFSNRQPLFKVLLELTCYWDKDRGDMCSGAVQHLQSILDGKYDDDNPFWYCIGMGCDIYHHKIRLITPKEEIAEQLERAKVLEAILKGREKKKKKRTRRKRKPKAIDISDIVKQIQPPSPPRIETKPEEVEFSPDTLEIVREMERMTLGQVHDEVRKKRKTSTPI